jgi:CelD/BcsL family acetyltransferase involved in cellulose biosynthesis
VRKAELLQTPGPTSTVVRSRVSQADGFEPFFFHNRDQSTSLTCRLLTQFADVEDLRPAWDDTVERTGGSVYMTYDWVRAWWNFYGESAELRLFAFLASERLVALVPVYIDTLGWPGLRLRVARLVGSNIPPKVFSPPVPDWCASQVLARVVAQLFGPDRCDVLSFGPVSGLEAWDQYFQAVCQQRADLVRQYTPAKGIHCVFHLPTDIEEYYATLSKNERKNRRKYDLRLLKKEHETRVDVLSEPHLVSEELERFARQHSRQWATERRPGHFGAWPRALEFNRALVDTQGKLGRLRFIRIVADGQVVCSQYTFAFGNRYYWELPARTVESGWERFSLGPTGIVTMLAQGIAEGMSRVEGGLAHYDYKVRLGAKEYATFTFRIVAARPLARVRFAIFSLARLSVSLVYHKVWYRRLMPRLPRVFWRPQWRLWLRLDF